MKKTERLKKRFSGYPGLVLKVLNADSQYLLHISVHDKEQINKILASSLTNMEGWVLNLRFGLSNHGNGYTLGEISSIGRVGHLGGISKARVGQLEKKALKKLRHPSKIEVFESCTRSGLENQIKRLKKEIEELKNQFPRGVLVTIDKIDFSERTTNILRSAGLSTLGKITEKSERDLLLLRNFGRKSLKEVKDILNHYGLKLKGDDEFVTIEFETMRKVKK